MGSVLRLVQYLKTLQCETVTCNHMMFLCHHTASSALGLLYVRACTYYVRSLLCHILVMDSIKLHTTYMCSNYCRMKLLRIADFHYVVVAGVCVCVCVYVCVCVCVCVCMCVHVYMHVWGHILAYIPKSEVLSQVPICI